ncbi:Ascorbate transporter, chloroplastic [Dichanthelium oligosanthes]|uniref:Ascorbate transporter, chloroplastic n=1 Tax=Dichanthelium oligosanthes TaxID=888268 RepID=A0A1E5VXX9_9POAL|nr:Ascorbate transporter, chloroplastic [Dichanthelium oligosanthes]
MAMGAVLSSRSFASPLSSGDIRFSMHFFTFFPKPVVKKHELKYSTSTQNKCVCSSVPGQRFHGHITGATLFPAQSHSRSTATAKHQISGWFQNPVLESSGDHLKIPNATIKRRVLSRVDCFLTSDPASTGWLKPRRWQNSTATTSDSACVHPEYRLPIRRRADCKAEQYEITGSLFSPSEDPVDAIPIGDTSDISSWWQQFPKRWTIVLLCFFSFLLCNMDRVNMSIAILPMASEFSWSPATVGLIQSSFFWGYLLTQILGGIWADRFGGKVVLGFGVVWWSIATVLTPLAAKIGLPCLLITRAFMGIGEGVAMPAMNNILSKWIPVSERSRSLALVYSGMYLGSVTGLAFSPLLISRFGWPSVFYAFGSLGSIWFALWQTKIMTPHYAICCAPQMPDNQVLKFNLTESGLLCVLPWLTMAVFANIGGWIADTLVQRGISITNIRKIMQSIGFLGPALFLTLLSKVQTPAMAVLCMACSQGSDAFSQSGLYSNHQDIGPRYAGVLLGLSNTAGVLAGVFGTAATGYILQKGSWDGVFKVSVALYIVGTVVWNIFSTGEKVLE